MPRHKGYWRNKGTRTQFAAAKAWNVAELSIGGCDFIRKTSSLPNREGLFLFISYAEQDATLNLFQLELVMVF
ncbi:hypothetical protein ASG89_02240 [Paenibacillus sp. Soil766]|uniref:hypothetical protein n=1 Tax=Paenibacillus sp. Soil766 TaxID=1736404 RepID=UPI00070F2C94|nr:hypothetical protein [Paenibacillus sp. Soil766]KRF03607.1 hypothetical protein ASG89_02240 [Paenibacillus sp. Soil766]